jgi:hypothetical protein
MWTFIRVANNDFDWQTFGMKKIFCETLMYGGDSILEILGKSF